MLTNRLFTGGLLSALLVLLAAGPFSGSAQAGESDREIGLLLYQLNHVDRAVVYLERAAASEPDAPQVAVPLGISLSQLERHDEAVDVLSRVSLTGESGADAAFFLGQSHQALGNTKAARKAYGQSVAMDGPLAHRALLESGRLALSTGNLYAAERDFRQLLDLEGAAEIMEEARVGLREVQRKRAQRPFTLTVDTGLRYDTNVPLRDDPDAEDQGFRSEVNLQARYQAWEEGPWRSNLAVFVSQGRFLSPAHRPFDLGIHQAGADLQYTPADLPLRFSLHANGDYFTQDFSRYRSSIGGGPRVTAAMGDHLATVLHWNWRVDDFQDDARDGRNRTWQLTQFVFWHDSGYAGVTGSYEQNRPQSQQWTYDQLGIESFAGDELFGGILVEGGLTYSLTPYLDQPEPRSGRTWTANAALGRNWGHWGVRLSGARMINTGLYPEPTAVAEAEGFSKTMVGLDLRARF